MRSATPSPTQIPAQPPAPGPTRRTAPDQFGAVVPGAPVEIWCRSLGVWSSGFVAVDLGSEGWQVLRRSDRSSLPVRFPADDVRPVPVTHHLH